MLFESWVSQDSSKIESYIALRSYLGGFKCLESAIRIKINWFEILERVKIVLYERAFFYLECTIGFSHDFKSGYWLGYEKGFWP